MSDEPIKLGCGLCTFTTSDPKAFADHMIITGHLAEMVPESGDVKELEEVLTALAEAMKKKQAGEPLPEGMEIKPVRLDDPKVPQEVREKLAKLRMRHDPTRN